MHLSRTILPNGRPLFVSSAAGFFVFACSFLQTLKLGSNFERHGSRYNLLDCKDIKNFFIPIRPLPGGAVKRMELGTLNGDKVVLSRPRNDDVFDDFMHGMKMLLAFRNSSLTIQLLGFCQELRKESIVTRYYENGDANNLDLVLHKIGGSEVKELIIRLQLASDYLSIINYLHDSPVGIRVMCDTNDLTKTLSQFVISDTLHLLLADVDALPEVVRGSKGVKCGHRQLKGSFVAPEQLWPWADLEFLDENMPSYDENIDVWRVPDVISFFIGNDPRGVQLKLGLFSLFQECKALNPHKRPSMREIIKRFQHSKIKLMPPEGLHVEL